MRQLWSGGGIGGAGNSRAQSRQILRKKNQQQVFDVEPKAILPFDPIPGQVPRKVAIDRKRKEFRNINFEQLLEGLGVDFNRKNAQVEWLQLEFFDDSTFDDNSNSDWLIRRVDEDGNFHVLSGKGLRNKNDKQYYDNLVVEEYDPKTELFSGKWEDGTEFKLNRYFFFLNIIQLPYLKRLYICFDAEDPRKYVLRVANAFQQRVYSDSLVRYNFLIDNMPLHDITDLDTEQKKRIENLAKTKKLESMETTTLTLEVNADFGRTMNKIIFDKYLEEQQEDESYPKYLQLPPPKEEEEVPYLGMKELERSKGIKEKYMFKYDEVHYVEAKDFTETFKEFCFASLFIKEEVIKALQDIRVECNNILKQTIFKLTYEEPMHLDQFKHIQESATSSVMYQLKGNWISQMVHIIKEQFKDVGKGWFNMKETSKITYDFGKLKRFLTVIRLMMQDTLLTLIRANFYDYRDTIKSFIPVSVKIHNSYKVTNTFPDGTVQESDAEPWTKTKQALFQIELQKHSTQDKFIYSINPANFVLVITHALKKALEELSKVPDLEPRILADLYKSQKLETYIKAPMLPPQEPKDPDPNERPMKFPDENKWVWLLLEELKQDMEKAILPLNDYLEVFQQFLPILELKPDDYTREIELEDPPREIDLLKEEIQQVKEKASKLKTLIPAQLHVTVFEIHLKDTLILLEERYDQLYRNLIGVIAKRARDASVKLFAHIRSIKQRIGEEPKDIEQLTDLKEYIANIPIEIDRIKVEMDKVFDIYKILEGFAYPFNKEEMQRRWNIFAGPREIHQEIDKRKNQLEKLKVKFAEEMKVQQDDFKEQFENLERTIQNFHHHQQLKDHQQVAEIVEYVQKQLQELAEQSRSFNSAELLFDKEQTDYSRIPQMVREFQPYVNLWTSANKWFVGHKKWLHDEWETVNAEEAERVVEDGVKNTAQVIRYMRDRELTGVMKIAESVKSQLDEFRPQVPLLLALRKKGMTQRHWNQVSSIMGIDPPISPGEEFTFEDALKLDLMNQVDKICDIGETAGKEFQIEQMLEKMQEVWEGIKFQVVPYKNTYILRGYDEIQVVLDEHIVNTQAMVFSPYKKFYEERILNWDKTLKKMSDILEEWAKFQQQWMYLQPIFDSQDIAKQLPAETKKFKTVDQTWKTTVTQAKAKEKVLPVCSEDGLWERLHEANKNLELIQKELNNYLEKKREKFARFYFLSNDELLEILSQTKEPTAVQPRIYNLSLTLRFIQDLKKVFENIHMIEFDNNKKIHAMFSAEKEKVDFVKFVDPNKKNVEDWMNELENMMKMSVRAALVKSIDHYKEIPRKEWVLAHPGQCVLNGSQIWWTTEVEEAMGEDNLRGYLETLMEQLRDLVDLVRTKLSKQSMTTMNALIVIDVHAREVVQKMVRDNIRDITDFDWISQLRYYWDQDDCYVRCVQTNFPYGYEYLGNTLRLVITPLTDKCYMTLMGALKLNLGGAPAGPAGTGKTESTKDLAKALAKLCVVFNCSDSMDYIMVGKFFKGLASAGAWACFDEFNRINIEVLSVIAQQLLVLFGEKAKGTPQVEFEGSLIKLQDTFSVFITMNPGYQGRTELPDNLKALFRSVAMMVPNYGMIGEILLMSFGFQKGKALAQKMVATFKLSSEQLSSQDHYDYGMRAVRSVINQAGNLKQQNPHMDEEQLLLRALRDVNVPKFLKDDLPLFENIIDDLFPRLERPKYSYGPLLPEIQKQCQTLQLQSVQPFMDKILQLYDTIQVRHGLMLVGPTGGGKTSVYKTLSRSITGLAAEHQENFNKVHLHILNPKSITMGQLYGQFNEQTHEWTDGVLAYLVRESVKDQSSDNHWIMFDGPVDALWIESMNTVLDDNKKLCLNSGQILTLTPHMTMMFEVEDLQVASPATVSRCGMVYMEPGALGVQPIFQSWVEKIPENIQQKKKIIRQKITLWYEQYIPPTLEFIRKNCKELITTMDNSLVQSWQRIMDCLMAPYKETEMKRIPNEELDVLEGAIEYIFHFSVVWSLLATTDNDGRIKANNHYRSLMKKNNAQVEFPEQGSIYDYQYSWQQKDYISWSQNFANFELDNNLKIGYNEIMIPTNDSTRNIFMMKLLLTNSMHVLCPGPTGTGKSQNAYHLLIKGISEEYQYIALTFSAQTSANQTQDTIDGKMDKRRKGFFGPPVGKKCIIFVDDLNMPKKEEYFAQPPIELLRQFLDHQGWYNRKELSFMRLEDIVLLSAMGPPGGGRTKITNRIVRHFNLIAYTELEISIVRHIFSTILNFFFRKFTDSVKNILPQLIDSVLGIYNRVRDDLLPTPTKIHYSFNMRDISKVFQGICTIWSKDCQETVQAARLWYHENMRVFHDRLVSDQDREYMKKLLEGYFSDFGLKKEEVLDIDRVIFCDFLQNREMDIRAYQQVTGNLDQFVSHMEVLLEEYNAEMGSGGGGKKQMKLVMFLDACEHIARIARILRQPSGNALLLGIGGSGRQSLTRMATFLSNYKLQQVEVIKNYNMRSWRDDVKRILMLAGLDNKQVTFLFVDTQIINEQMLEDINNILNSGDVTNIYNESDMEEIMKACKAECNAKKLQPNKMNIFTIYLGRVKRNIHIVIAMSPIGNAFTTRLRMFPSLVNCCTIDWFTQWPEEALQGVGQGQLSENAENLGIDLSKIRLVDMFKYMHKSVERISLQYREELRRINYVTPTSYLELLNLYKQIVEDKRKDLKTSIVRLQNGLDKLQAANVAVEDMRLVLQEMQPELEKAQLETEKMMEKLKVEKDEADQTQKMVQKEEAIATKQANEANQLAKKAKETVAEANEQLEATLVKVKELKKEHLVEVKSLLQPPEAVRIVLAGVVILNTDQIKKSGEIIMQNIPGQIGKKEENYFDTAKKYLLNDTKELLNLLQEYDKDSINGSYIAKIEQKVMSHPKFNEKDAYGASKATGFEIYIINI